ncbi:MAG: indole-3-glycerol phosphate synthase TrpC [Calditrichaeota bacterium]|nr:MAG: indole-3-glycerol phosphate synthase TrpC [Calditrichota bacterium]MBL1204206.1 indole-3-glycerol phosphate synthase TrpC [Calditrichota bacterium]NOG44036.1 indole-3-glycerol phosphate synthase TrpC [Calditrichota bacterium]
MHDKLKEIFKVKLEEIEQIRLDGSDKRQFPLVSFKDQIASLKKLALIAEIKKASPSKGIIRKDFNIDEIIDSYSSMPANAVSILTDEKFFQGSKTYLSRFKTLSKLPALRKDFIIDEKQVYESFNIGADIILLIVAMLSKEKLQSLYRLATSLGMEVLVEAHTENEVKTALDIGADIIGINSRDLNTFKVDLNNALKLCSSIPSKIIKVAESGIHTADDIKKIEAAGFNAVLIGEAFMTSESISQKYRELFSI